MSITHDAIEVIKQNDRHRLAKSDSVLIKIGQFTELIPIQYRYGCTTVVPKSWPAQRKICKDEYVKKFYSKFPHMLKILPIENVVVAGGAASWPFGETSAKVGDIDLFIIGIDPNNKQALWRKVQEVAEKIRNTYSTGVESYSTPATAITETMVPGLVTFTIKYFKNRGSNDEEQTQIIQVILRVFERLSQVLLGFDISSCSIAFDGNEVYMTSAAAWSLAFRTNIICPAYRSTTYESRLIKYFTNYGFAIAFPHLRPELLIKDVPLHLPHMTIIPTSVRGRFAVGTITLPKNVVAPNSDYDMSDPAGPLSVWSLETAAAYAPNNLNMSEVLKGTGRFIVMNIITVQNTRSRRWSQDIPEERKNGIKFGDFAQKEITFKDLLPKTIFDAILNRTLKSILTRSGRISIAALRKFGLTQDEISHFVLELTSIMENNPNSRIDITPSFIKFCDKFNAAYAAVPNDVGWWILTDPSRQYTVTLNPRYETPHEWYGNAFSSLIKSPDLEEYVEVLCATLEMRQRLTEGADQQIYDGICALCLNPIYSGVANSVTFQCGHVLHWAQTSDCAGIRSWTTTHDNCPTCRNTFTSIIPIDNIPSNVIPLNITW